ncbi:MAG TPA: benzaldehyde dehydrogenase [Candidatus Sulfotelmatobacter sp.]|nr:benzaldehyde dehydrogenase [Candidatus Sulfotelmatobacter sp.]
MIETSAPGLLRPDRWDGRFYSDGWRSTTGGTADVLDKSTGAVIGRIGVASVADVAAASKRAADAFPSWAATAPAERAAILHRAADLLEAAAGEISPWNVRETGGIPAKAGFEVQIAAGELRESANLVEHEARRIIERTAEVESIAVRVPIGVVGVITPWNMPLILAMRSVAPALALGNTVVLKPDLQTAVIGGFVIAEVLEQAGLPAGVFHVVPGDAEPGAALTEDPNVSMISFTGSTAVGRLVGAAAGRSLKRVALELGGNSPFIVLDDADLDLASSAGAFGSFFHQGQICMASSRHLVHERIAGAYVSKLVERAARLPVGDPSAGEVALGPLINDEQLARVVDIVDRTVQAGARVVTGATHEGRFYRPTVLTGVTPDMPAFSEEIFGPVAPITTFATDEEAIALANRTEYGLSSGIYSANVARAGAIAARLRTGLAHVNDQTVNDDPRIPFGGFGASGNGGRFGSLSNLEEFTTWRWLTIRQRGHQYPF